MLRKNKPENKTVVNNSSEDIKIEEELDNVFLHQQNGKEDLTKMFDETIKEMRLTRSLVENKKKQKKLLFAVFFSFFAMVVGMVIYSMINSMAALSTDEIPQRYPHEHPPQMNVPIETELKLAPSPVQVEKWLLEEGGSRDEVEQKLVSYTHQNNTETFSLSFPSAQHGYTSDRDKLYLDDKKTPNPDFSWSTKEDWLYFVNYYIQNLINPYFGNWVDMQYGDQVPLMMSFAYTRGRLMDMLGDDYIKTWSEDEETIARLLFVMADWNEDSYGGMEFKTKARWMGQLKGISFEPYKIESEYFDWERKAAVVKAEIEFYGMLTSGERTVIKKELEFIIAENIYDQSPNQLVITERLIWRNK